MTARAAEEPGGVEVALLADDRRRHSGQELVAHIAEHAAAPRAEQAVIGPEGRGVIERDPHAGIRLANLVDDRAHRPCSFSSMPRISSRRSFFEILPTA